MRIKIVLLCSVIFLCQCSVFSPVKLPSVSTYTINSWLDQKTKSPHPTSSRALFVTVPTASAGYNTNSMIYVAVPYKLKSFADNDWVAPPAELMLELLTDQIRALGYFHAVVTPPFSGSTTFQMNTQLLVLQQEFLKPISQVRLALEVTLIDVPTGQVLASRVFSAVIPAPGNNPYSGVLATNQVANLLAKQISAFVVRESKHIKSSEN